MGRRGQQGQTIALAAISMVVLLAMVGLVLSGGNLYWDRRHLQELVDSAALASALKGPGSCSRSTGAAVMDEADRVMGLQLGSHTGGSGMNGTCGAASGYTQTFTYPGGYTATVNYPYVTPSGAHLGEVEVLIQNSPDVLLAAFVGSNATVRARAVAEFSAGTPSMNFAVYGRQFVGCQGSAVVSVQGSVYSYGLPQGNGTCAIWARSIIDGNGNYLDYGNFLVHADGMGQWQCAHWCADGYEKAGHTAPYLCGVTGTTQYRSGYPEGANSECANGTPWGPAPDLNYPAYPDPNLNIPGHVGTPMYTPTQTSGCDPSPTAADSSGYIHYHPGCYSTVALGGTNAILDPGFYYFGVGNGNGVCLQGSGRLLGNDVVLEFVNGANFTSLDCNLGGACGRACGFGSDPTQNPLDPPSTATYFAAPDASSSWCTGSCPLRGELVYKDPSGTGTWDVKGSSETSFIKGLTFWPEQQCLWWANGAGIYFGQMVCGTVYLQGGSSSSGSAVTYGTFADNQTPAEAGLIE